MPEISLNILDVAENSIRAGAGYIEIDVIADSQKDTLEIMVRDDGCGMDEEQVRRVTDPFYTTRTTRRVGLGIPFFKQAAESTGGSFQIASRVNEGTCVKAIFGLSHIDRMPLGDMAGTVTALIRLNPGVDFVYRHTVDGRSFEMDTRELRAQLGDVPLSDPDVMEWIDGYLREQEDSLGGTA